MKSKLRCIFPAKKLSSPVAFAVAVLIAAEAFAQGENHLTNIVSSLHGFELKLPPGWTTVNSNLLAVIRRMGHSHDSTVPSADGVYAYHRASDHDEFNPPYLMIAVKNVGRIPQTYANKLSVPGRAQQELDAAFRGSIKDSLPEGYRLINAAFDTNLYAMRMEMEFKSELGQLHFTAVNFFTEKGTVEITGMTRSEGHIAWAGTFDEIIASVRFADWLQYRRRPPMNLASGATDWLYPLGGVAIVVVGGFFYIRYLRNRESAADY